MATVNKPILLDETGKDLASAIREQTTELKNAISAISVGGGGTGGGDDGYFPSNQTEFTFSFNPVVTEYGMIFLCIYDPELMSTPPPKYVFFIGFDETLAVQQGIYVYVAAWTDEEVLEGTAEERLSFGVLTPVTIEGEAMCVGMIHCPKADGKKLWIAYSNASEGLIVMPQFAFC